MASKVPSVKFNNGHSMPMFGLGTYLSTAGEVEQAVKVAIDAGYRHIDTAYFYKNEKEVGDAVRAKIEDGTVTRAEMFITTKLWCSFHRENKVVNHCKESLESLGLGYIDLYLVHWPFALEEGDALIPMDENGKWIFEDVDYLETWRGMEECVRQGLVRSIGISNYNSEQIERLLTVAKIKPVNNQVEVNINLPNIRLIEFCKQHDITVTAYSPLSRPGNRHGIDSSLGKVEAIAKKYNKSGAQIAFRFIYQLGATPIPKSVTPDRIKENINIFDFELTPEEMQVIKSVGNGKRVAELLEAKDDKYYPFSIPF